MTGRPATGNICLGVENVRGRSLVPSPPTRTTAFTAERTPRRAPPLIGLEVIS